MSAESSINQILARYIVIRQPAAEPGRGLGPHGPCLVRSPPCTGTAEMFRIALGSVLIDPLLCERDMANGRRVAGPNSMRICPAPFADGRVGRQRAQPVPRPTRQVSDAGWLR
jgi:hypothetical protein